MENKFIVTDKAGHILYIGGDLGLAMVAISVIDVPARIYEYFPVTGNYSLCYKISN